MWDVGFCCPLGAAIEESGGLRVSLCQANASQRYLIPTSTTLRQCECRSMTANAREGKRETRPPPTRESFFTIETSSRLPLSPINREAVMN